MYGAERWLHRMPEECKVCDAPLEAGASHCGRCGFPTALTAAAVMGLGRAGFAPVAEAPANGGAVPAAVTPSTAEPPENATIAQFAHEVSLGFGLIHQLGGEYTDLLGEVQQAALLQADGRTNDTLALLRNSQLAVSTRMGELFDHRLGEFEERQHTLVRQGLAPELLQESVRLRAEAADAPVERVAEHLAEADRRLAQTESDWGELKAMLRQVDQVRVAAGKVGQEFPQVDAEFEPLRTFVDRTDIRPAELAEALASSSKILRFYHEALSPQLQAELDQHAARLAQHRPDHVPSRKARQTHSDANRHLRSGRVAEAALRLDELRASIRELDALPPDPPEPEPEPVDVPVEGPRPAPPAQAISALMLRARELAARIKHLPPNSPRAERAAQGIRAATELLRDRRLEEADRTLQELMRSLEEPEAMTEG
ncbi:MAG TPA: hypothetical protein VGV89_01330 [Thermoplasmata archaeon]|nr:hypothetical protein [Thermoplasmata archaeon]